MLILLPPSEGKRAPTRGAPLRPERLSFPDLARPRAEVLDALVALCTTQSDGGLAKAAAVLGVGPGLLPEVARNARLTDAPAARADRVYSGVLYEALDLPALRGAARTRASRWLAITSALFGLLRPTDAIPAYRLAGDVGLPGIGNIGAFWRGHLDAAVADAAGRGLVVDLRSTAYAAFWRPPATTADRVVTVRVLQETGGRRSVVSHFNKATKGRLVRSLLEDGGRPTSVSGFADHLTDRGWRVEQQPPTRTGHRLDVVVTDL